VSLYESTHTFAAKAAKCEVAREGFPALLKMEKTMKTASNPRVLSSVLALALAACGGGGGSSPASPGGSSGPSAATSSGAITAFGSVFVNGHEYATGGAQVVDDDTGATDAKVSSLEVGQVVDVQPASNSTATSPVARWLHVHPLVRGYVDAWDGSANTLTVMGQSVTLDSATLFSDHRACVSAATNACSAITGASGLGLTSTGGGGTTPGSYVSVDGYLFAGASGSADVVATLVSVHDAPTGTAGPLFKVEGVVDAATATAGSVSITIGNLQVNLDSATCRAMGQTTDCAGAFGVGDVVSAFAATSPTLPAATLDATFALKRSHLPVQTAGATVEFDGSVSSSTPASGGTAASFVVRGVNIDTSALAAGTSLPAVGDIVRVAGALSSDGLSVVASSIRILRAARSASYAFAGDATGVAAGSVANTYTVTVLGEPIVVSSQTRLADRSTRHWFDVDPQSNPFNIATFQTYLAASSSQHLVVKTAKDSAGTLQALSVTIVPASSVSQVAGPVDATPVPVAGSASAPTTFSIDGLPVSAAVSAITFGRHAGSAIAAGDEVLAAGSFAASVLGVGATPSFSNFVLDLGVPTVHDIPGF
jgi:hypothetical protein